MKCGKCGNNEAIFHYKSMVDGNVTELHLCQDCANTDEFQGFFDMRGGFGDLFGGSFVRPDIRMMNNFTDLRELFAPAYAVTPVFFAPDRGEHTMQEIPKEASEGKIPNGVDSEIAKRRELCALEYELKKAVNAEEFERAAELRDKIRDFDKEI